jgi:diacylglycerol kinase (ATP)
LDSSPRFVFLVNASAGTGRGPRRLAHLVGQRPGVAARSRTIASSTPAELANSLRLADDEIPVAVGGDGSFNALITLLDRRGELQRTVGLIPFGTGNASAHTLGLRSTAVAMSALERGEMMSLDIMRTSLPDNPIALVSCSTGFESSFLERYGALRYKSKQWAGWSALVLNASKQFTGVSLTLDGVPWVQSSDVTHNVGLYNIPHYAFGKIMWRGMQPDDGLAIAASVSSPLAYWNLMVRGVTAPNEGAIVTRQTAGVRTARWRSAHITSPLALQIDGEAVTAREAQLTIDSRAVTAIHAR